jgi:hypothetical protein
MMDLVGEAVARADGDLVSAGLMRERRAALHESAHAVIGWVVGDRPILEVGLGSDGSGWILHTSIIADVGTDLALLRRRVERAIVALYSGPEADARPGAGVAPASGTCDGIEFVVRRLTVPRRAASLDLNRVLDDLRHIDKLAAYVVTEDQQPDFLARLKTIAHVVVSDQWTTIEAVASMLLQQRWLSGRELERYLAAHAQRDNVLDKGPSGV